MAALPENTHYLLNVFNATTESSDSFQSIYANNCLPSNTLATSVLYDSNLKGVRKPREPR